MSTECEITGVKSENIPPIWHLVSPLIERALQRVGHLYTVASIFDALMYHKMQLWVIVTDEEIQGMMVTEFSVYPEQTICRIVLTAGESFKDWEFCVEEIEQWALEEGAGQVHVIGRFGWKPWAKKLGYDVHSCLYTKDLQIHKSRLQS